MDRIELKRIYDGAKNNDSESLFLLGKMFSDGSSFPRIMPVAVNRYIEAGGLGNKEAKVELLKVYKNFPQELSGKITESELLNLFEGEKDVDAESAVTLAQISAKVGSANNWVEAAALSGDPESACRIGFNALFGKDSLNPGIKDYDKALANLQVAMEGNIPLSFFCMAFM